MRLRDQISATGTARGNNTNSYSGKGGVNRNICYKFNRGRCTYGFNCKFEHKCAICGKFGHGACNCRKASGAEKQQWVQKNSETGETYYSDKRDDRDRKSGGGGNGGHHHKRKENK